MFVKIAKLKCSNNKLDSSTTTIHYVQLQKSWKTAQKSRKNEWAYESLAY